MDGQLVVTPPPTPLHYEPAAVVLVVEVESPATRLRDRGSKKALCEEHGIEQYWVVDTDAETLSAWQLRHGDHALAWRMAPGTPGQEWLGGVHFADLTAE